MAKWKTIKFNAMVQIKFMVTKHYTCFPIKKTSRPICFPLPIKNSTVHCSQGKTIVYKSMRKMSYKIFHSSMPVGKNVAHIC